MEIPTFKIRASAAHEILGGAVGLTEKQEARYNELKLRDDGIGKKLTDNMEAELDTLKYKIVNPQLPEGAKTYCEKWLKEQLYDRRKNFANKYLEKGIACEDESIKYAAEQLGWYNAKKNEEWFEDDFFQGTPDIITELFTAQVQPNLTVREVLKPTVIDMKNVWDCFTMPLFEEEIPTKGYETQLQVYMHLVSKEYKVPFDQAILCYALMDAPLNVMEKEMRNLSWEQGQQGLVTDEIRQKVHKEMTYSDLPAELRLKTYEVKRDESVIQELIFRVELCREYIDGLLLARGYETVAC